MDKKKHTPKKRKKTTRKKEKDNLLPLLVILIVLLILVSFLAFSDKSNFLSDLFFRKDNSTPAIERPEIIQSNTAKSEDKEDSYAVTNEVKASPESTQKTDEPIQTAEPEKTMKSRLFFVKVSDEGQISLKSIIRTINYQSMPLTETLKSLIEGPDRTDLNKGLLNLIPKDTKLLSVKISGGTAYLDFNENFRYNSLGIEGLKAQLMQIVFTATEFESVSTVQILIEGKKVEYLGAEGVYIGKPLDRDYFNTF